MVESGGAHAHHPVASRHPARLDAMQRVERSPARSNAPRNPGSPSTRKGTHLVSCFMYSYNVVVNGWQIRCVMFARRSGPLLLKLEPYFINERIELIHIPGAISVSRLEILNDRFVITPRL